SDAEFRRFIRIAMGSLAEVRTLLEFAHRRRWLAEPDHAALEALIEELRQALLNLLRAIALAMRRKQEAPGAKRT
ncbi:MAG: four helix bundle protein, partial [Planctomycetota bacterium]